jgi:hypothetical protein
MGVCGAWLLRRIKSKKLSEISAEDMAWVKQKGFSDAQIARYTGEGAAAGTLWGGMGLLVVQCREWEWRGWGLWGSVYVCMARMAHVGG